MSLIDSMVVRLTGDGTSYQTMIATAVRTTGQFVQGIGAKFVGLGAQMSMLTARMGSFGKEVARMGMNFELEMSRIEGLVGASQKQMQEYEEAILRIAPALGKAPQELASGLYYITSAGFEGAQAIDVLEKSARASVAGLGQTQTVADLITTAMTAYGKETLSAAKATDVLTAAVREGKAEATSFADAMGRVIPLAAVMGISFGEVAAAIAVMSKGGLDAFEATTALRGVMGTLQHPTEGSRESLRMYGLSAGKLRDMLRGPNGLMEVLRLMKERFGDATDNMSAVIPNVRALTGAFNLLGQSAKDVDKAIKLITEAEGDLDKAYEVTARQSAQQLAVANATINVQLIQLGKDIAQSVVPWFMRWNELIASGIKWVNEFSPNLKGMLAVLGAVAAAAGPVLITFGLLFPLLAAGVSTIGTLIAALQKLAAALVAAQLSGGWVAIGAAALAAGYGLVVWANNLRGVTAAMREHQAALREYQAGTEALAASDAEATASALKRIDAITDRDDKLSAIRDQTASIRKELEKAEAGRAAAAEALKGVHGERLGSFGEFLAGIGLPGGPEERNEQALKAIIRRYDEYIAALGDRAKKIKDKQGDVIRAIFEEAEKKRNIFQSTFDKLMFDLKEREKFIGFDPDQKRLAQLIEEGLAPWDAAKIQAQMNRTQLAEATAEVDKATAALIDQFNTFDMTTGAATDYANAIKGVSKAAMDANRMLVLMVEGQKVTREFETAQERFAREKRRQDELFLNKAIGIETYTKAILAARKGLEGLARAIDAVDIRSAEFFAMALTQFQATVPQVELPKMRERFRPEQDWRGPELSALDPFGRLDVPDRTFGMFPGARPDAAAGRVPGGGLIAGLMAPQPRFRPTGPLDVGLNPNTDFANRTGGFAMGGAYAPMQAAEEKEQTVALKDILAELRAQGKKPTLEVLGVDLLG